MGQLKVLLMLALCAYLYEAQPCFREVSIITAYKAFLTPNNKTLSDCKNICSEGQWADTCIGVRLSPKGECALATANIESGYQCKAVYTLWEKYDCN